MPALTEPDPRFPGRLAIQQRVVPEYRRAFFDRLAGACVGGLSVFAGRPTAAEATPSAQDLGAADLFPTRNVHILSGPLYLCLQPGIEAWLELVQPDALVVEANPREWSNRKAIAWMKRRARPVLGWGLGAPSSGGPLGALQRAARRSLLGKLDGVIAYSTRGQREFRALGLPAQRVFVAPNAVSPRPSDRDVVERTGADRPPRLLFVGRLQRRKRVDHLLKVCASLGQAIELWIVGDGPAGGELKALAAHVFPQAQFLGHRSGLALEKLFAEADLFVLPGSGGLAVQQALAHGLPVVVAAGDGSQEDMVQEDNGWLVRPDDLADLSRAVRAAIAARPTWPAMGEASRRKSRLHFNLEAMVEAFVAALNAVRGES
jgi:glycosyltransferase involved in cell wall biosynthesis